jgi:hypothetical protein
MNDIVSFVRAKVMNKKELCKKIAKKILRISSEVY